MTEQNGEGGTRKRGVRRWALGLAAAGVAGLLLAEGVARWGLGLGDPPLSVADPEVEYRFRPGEYRRFGNRVFYNEQSMRSEPWPDAAPDELRVLVLGDSVVNGGSQTDQTELATELLEDRLAARLGRPVRAGNVSAGSWGPGNLLAWTRKHGPLGADVAVIVVSSHDAADNPTFEPIVGVDPNFPAEAPWLALEEAVVRYLPRYLPDLAGGSPGPDSQAAAVKREPTAEEVARGLADLRALVEEWRAAGADVVVIQHQDREELAGGPKPGHAAIGALMTELGVPVVQLGPAMAAELRAGRSPYRDNIHLNEHGQAVLAGVLEGVVAERVEE